MDGRRSIERDDAHQLHEYQASFIARSRACLPPCSRDAGTRDPTLGALAGFARACNYTRPGTFAGATRAKSADRNGDAGETSSFFQNARDCMKRNTREHRRTIGIESRPLKQ